LPAPLGPISAKIFAVVDIEVDASHRLMVAVPFGQVAHAHGAVWSRHANEHSPVRRRAATTTRLRGGPPFGG
jgi:hypothetical protein